MASLPNIDDFLANVTRKASVMDAKPESSHIRKSASSIYNSQVQHTGNQQQPQSITANYNRQNETTIYNGPYLRLPNNNENRQGFADYWQQLSSNHPPRKRRQVWNCDACSRHYFVQADFDEHMAQHIKCPHKQCKYEAHVNLVLKHFELQHLTGLFDRIGKLETPEEIAEWHMLRKARFPKSRAIAATITVPNFSRNMPEKPSPLESRSSCDKFSRGNDNDDDCAEVEEGEIVSSSSDDDDEGSASAALPALPPDSSSGTSSPQRNHVASVDANALLKMDKSYVQELFDYFMPSRSVQPKATKTARANFNNNNKRRKLSLRDRLVEMDLRKDFENLKKLRIYTMAEFENRLKLLRYSESVKQD